MEAPNSKSSCTAAVERACEAEVSTERQASGIYATHATLGLRSMMEACFALSIHDIGICLQMRQTALAIESSDTHVRACKWPRNKHCTGRYKPSAFSCRSRRQSANRSSRSARHSDKDTPMFNSSYMHVLELHTAGGRLVALIKSGWVALALSLATGAAGLLQEDLHQGRHQVLKNRIVK